MEQALTLQNNASQKMYQVLGASLLISLLGCIQIPLFFTPIPFVIQNSASIALGAILGPKKGCAAVALFILYGWLGLPVFSGGHGGLSVLMSPFSGGYLLGYCAAAFLTGKMLEWAPDRLFSALLVGHATILLCGCSFFAAFVGWNQAFYLGFLPFIGLDLIKASLLFKALKLGSL